MRVAAERRADGVYIAAGVELIEPETRHESPRGDWVEPSRVTRLGDRLRWQTAKRLREAIGHRDASVGLYHRTPVLKACHCSAVFVGDPCTRHCPRYPHRRPALPCEATTAPSCLTVPPVRRADDGEAIDQGVLLGEMPSGCAP
jgi:hypothetical protein